METVKIEKLIHGGQGIGTLPDGRKIFVWNALPDEKVGVRLVKNKRSYAEGVAETIYEASSERTRPNDDAYLSTSPWQIMTFAAENRFKTEILTEAMKREGVNYAKPIQLYTAGEPWYYRNKMEYSFWADDDGLHLALFQRGSHGKRIIAGSSIARPEIDVTANRILDVLNNAGIRGSQLKTVMVRCSQAGDTVAALFVKDEAFPDLSDLKDVCKGVGVYYSNPKSPASLATRQLHMYGKTTLTDTILGVPISYDVLSFFQVNLPVFELAAKRIDYFTGGIGPKIDFYSGVGTIGVPVNATVLVESDPHNITYARKNVANRPVDVVQAAAEESLAHIEPTGTLIVDPPRAGLHPHVVRRILEVKPGLIAYLSCNPATNARDLALLQEAYTIKLLEGYNFFPRTPHIEALAVLVRQ